MRKRGVSIRAMATALVLALGITSCALDAADTEEAAAALPAAITAGGTISGTVFQDMNRSGAQDAGESAIASIQLYLFDGNWAYLGTTLSDAAGHYAFGGLADGAYQVAFATPSWWSLRQDWVPTTTAGSLFPQRTVSLSSAAVADFGLRPIVRSTDLAAPIATFTGPNGLVVMSYDDVVSPQDVHASIMAGLVGPEASRVVVHFDHGNGSITSTSATQTNGQYSGYQASVYIAYENWLDSGGTAVAHEYGHAWSLYYAYIVQQDPTMASYLAARGLAGDPRIDSSYEWSKREMIAEDYRQLLGAPSARSGPQLNSAIPPASAVPGLADFLQNTFTQSSAAPPPPPPPPVVALAISGPAVTPSPIVKSGTISFGLSAAASVTVTIRTTNGSVVRTLLSNVPEQAGGTSVAWDRKDGSGHHVKAGTYAARVDAVSADNQTATSSTAFSAN